MALLPPHVAAGRATVYGPIGSAQVVLVVRCKRTIPAPHACATRYILDPNAALRAFPGADPGVGAVDHGRIAPWDRFSAVRRRAPGILEPRCGAVGRSAGSGVGGR